MSNATVKFLKVKTPYLGTDPIAGASEIPKPGFSLEKWVAAILNDEDAIARVRMASGSSADIEIVIEGEGPDPFEPPLAPGEVRSL